MNAHSRLVEAIVKLPSDGDEIAVLASVAEGLVKGHGIYGALHLDSDGRDMRAETTEELRDAVVYLTAALLREKR
jgi:hypothetical protein